MEQRTPSPESKAPEFTHYHALIIGTGLTECALSGALALAGKKVLHVEEARRYGSAQADFRLKEFIEFLKEEAPRRKHAMMRDFEHSSLEGFESMPPKELSQYSRKFIIELMPLVLFSKSYGVDFLISSGCAMYLQFNTVCNNYFAKGSQIYRIPYSKSDIFLSSELGLKEKRELSRVISNCLHFATDPDSKDINSTHIYEKDTEVNPHDQDLYSQYKARPVSEYFHKLGVDSKVLELLLYAIAFINESDTKTTTEDFFKRTAKYLRSIGYYGNSPMIMSEYGSSQYLQAFSRLSAVFGGLFAINEQLGIQELQCEDGLFKRTIIKGLQEQPISADHVYLSREYQHLLPSLGPQFYQEEDLLLAHMILFTRKPLISDLSSVGLFVIAPSHPLLLNTHPIRILQQGSFSNNMPQGEYLLHCTTMKPKEDAQEQKVFHRLRDCLFKEFATSKDKSTQEDGREPEDKKGQEEKGGEKEEEVKEKEEGGDIFFYCTYNQHMLREMSEEEKKKVGENVHLIKGSDFELDLDTDLVRAENLYYAVEGEDTSQLFLERKKEQQQEELLEQEGESEDMTIDGLLAELGDI